MVTKITEARHAGGFILSEANGNRSRENVIIASGQDLEDGAVLGKLTSGGHYAAFNNDASDGTQTVAGILLAGCDASAAAEEAAIIARDAEVNQHELVWADTEDDTDKAAGVTGLEALGIRVR